jgi:hypothetical protein
MERNVDISVELQKCYSMIYSYIEKELEKLSERGMPA